MDFSYCIICWKFFVSGDKCGAAYREKHLRCTRDHLLVPVITHYENREIGIQSIATTQAKQKLKSKI
ncbi:hypothetical protein AC249_AIPGENE18081 [Exaiptasia diaphana]|nr:hypothetical protein AC249_AIPGENE18081 [Exaiptasia diaphana]